MNDEQRVEEIRERAKRISSKWLVQWVQPTPVSAGYPEQAEIEYIRVEDDMREMLRQYDAQREQLDKMREALEGALDLAMEVESAGDRVRNPSTQYLVDRILELGRDACEALGREWGYWRDAEGDNEADTGRISKTE